MNNKIKISTLTEFGVALRKLRLDYGERMGDMAERLHFSTAYLSAIENGRQSIPHMRGSITPSNGADLEAGSSRISLMVRQRRAIS